MPTTFEVEELNGVVGRCNQAINTARAKVTKANVQIKTCQENLKQINEDLEAKRTRLVELRSNSEVSLREYRDVQNIIVGSEDMISTIQSDLAVFLGAVQENEAEIRNNEEIRSQAQAKLAETAKIIPFPVRQ